jgi:GlpG protein
MRRDSIPLSFILVSIIFIGGQLLQVFQQDSISQTAHIVGGIIGAASGFQLARQQGQDATEW